MSDYEAMMIRKAEQRAIRRRDALKRLALTLTVVLAVILALVGLERICFISRVFMVILLAVTMCVGSFKAGNIWRDLRW